MEYRNKILIISMNPLSNTMNNGKTIESFFEGYPIENIAQLYFSSTFPESTVCKNFYKISDLDMLRVRLRKTQKCGEIVNLANLEQIVINGDERKTSKIRKNNLSRMLREALWNKSWNTVDLKRWLNEFSPDIIFFVAGDVVFSYKICEEIRRYCNTKVAIFITDDYILPRITVSFFWWIRRAYILKYMRKAVVSADLFITISDLMRTTYKSFFGRDSYVAVNMTDSLKIPNLKFKGQKKELVMVYAGGIHLNRWKTLVDLANKLKLIEDVLDMKASLKIYCAQSVSEKIKKRLTIPGVSSFEGAIKKDELKVVLSCADVLVHVESFKRRNIYDTRLSLSTKIPEYLSVGKPILAIGPKSIASMQYLQDVACCVNDLKDLQGILKDILQNVNLRKQYGTKALEKYCKNHVASIKRKELQQMIDQI